MTSMAQSSSITLGTPFHPTPDSSSSQPKRMANGPGGSSSQYHTQVSSTLVPDSQPFLADSQIPRESLPMPASTSAQSPMIPIATVPASSNVTGAVTSITPTSSTNVLTGASATNTAQPPVDVNTVLQCSQ
ncbi:hypothetical protein RUND412_010473 [Rhizina undulata]